MYVIGIDGGGTKTTGVIANTSGEVIKEVTVGGSNLNSTKKSVVESELAKLIETLKNESNVDFSQVRRVFAGMSGAGHLATKNELQGIITSLLPQTVNVTVDNDAITALYSGTLGEPGIVQIAGTGAITYGVNSIGDRGRVGGWGHLFGDHGSGYTIGRDGLNAAFMAYDGLTGHTYLTELLLNHFQVKDLSESIRPIYQGENPKEIIASLSKLVVEASDMGDKTAIEIINRNGQHLGASISSLIKKLFSDEQCKANIPVVLAGGLFNRLDLFKVSIEQVIEANNLIAELTIPKISPVGGAVIAALREEDVKVDENK